MESAVFTRCREALECPLCMSLFDEPITLLCGHTFCRLCAQRAIAAAQMSTRQQCPMCRAPVYLDLSSVVGNIALTSVIEMLFPADAAEREKNRPNERLEHSSQRLPLFFVAGQAPGSRVLPGGPVTLVVYEPRYLMLVQRCLENNIPFGLCASPEAMAGTLLRIESRHPMADGRVVITAKAQSRFRLLSSSEVEPGSAGLYIGHAIPFHDEPQVADGRFVQRLDRAPQGHITSRLSVHASRLLCQLDNAGAAEVLRDVCAEAAVRMLAGLSEGRMRLVHSVHGPPPGTSGPAATPERWSCWLASALALSYEDGLEAQRTQDAVYRLLLCYATLEEIDCRLRSEHRLETVNRGDRDSDDEDKSSGRLLDADDVCPVTGLCRLRRVEAEHGLDLFAREAATAWGGPAGLFARGATAIVRLIRDSGHNPLASSILVFLAVGLLILLFNFNRGYLDYRL